MWIKNNSKKEWLNYNLGKKSIDVKAESVFQIEDDLGRRLLSLLGSEDQLVVTEAPVIKEKEKAVKKEKKEKVFVTTDDVVIKKSKKKSKKINK